jgi:hypothetical protein
MVNSLFEELDFERPASLNPTALRYGFYNLTCQSKWQGHPLAQSGGVSCFAKSYCYAKWAPKQQRQFQPERDNLSDIGEALKMPGSHLHVK